jgi:hypothetical protein
MDCGFKGGNGFRVRWKQIQGRVEGFSEIGGKIFGVRWKQIRGKEERFSHQKTP